MQVRNSSVSKVNVMSASRPKADVRLLDYLRSASDPKQPLKPDPHIDVRDDTESV